MNGDYVNSLEEFDKVGLKRPNEACRPNPKNIGKEKRGNAGNLRDEFPGYTVKSWEPPEKLHGGSHGVPAGRVKEMGEESWSDHIDGQVRPMCALDPVVRAVLCALLGDRQCYGETLYRNDEESGGTPPNHMLYSICCFVVPLFFTRAFQTKVNVLYTQWAKSHLPLMHRKETRAYGENYKSLALARDALKVKEIYFNKEYVSENENLRFS
ncbi:hypothetical protein AgCh_009067 [Apium graveolens]